MDMDAGRRDQHRPVLSWTILIYKRLPNILPSQSPYLMSGPARYATQANLGEELLDVAGYGVVCRVAKHVVFFS